MILLMFRAPRALATPWPEASCRLFMVLCVPRGAAAPSRRRGLKLLLSPERVQSPFRHHARAGALERASRLASTRFQVTRTQIAALHVTLLFIAIGVWFALRRQYDGAGATPRLLPADLAFCMQDRECG